MKDENEKDKLEQEVTNIINEIKQDAINSFKDESDIKTFLDNIIKLDINHISTYSLEI